MIRVLEVCEYENSLLPSHSILKRWAIVHSALDAIAWHDGICCVLCADTFRSTSVDRAKLCGWGEIHWNVHFPSARFSMTPRVWQATSKDESYATCADPHAGAFQVGLKTLLAPWEIRIPTVRGIRLYGHSAVDWISEPNHEWTKATFNDLPAMFSA